MNGYNYKSLVLVIRDALEPDHLYEAYFYADHWIDAYADHTYFDGYEVAELTHPEKAS